MNGSDVGTSPDAVLVRLTRDILQALGESLVGLYVFGSWVAGDFDPARSDLDLLAVLDGDPTERLADDLSAMHQRLAVDLPVWSDRVEVEYVSVAALSEFRAQQHLMARISPGEPFHRVRVTNHHLLNWYSARYEGRSLIGPAAGELIPDFTEADFRAVVLEHARQWPHWVQDHKSPDSQAYAVLTLCRTLYSATEGGQSTKRCAAEYGRERLPQWRDLIAWALLLCYNRTDAIAVDQHREVTRFVREVVDIIEAPTG